MNVRIFTVAASLIGLVAVTACPAKAQGKKDLPYQLGILTEVSNAGPAYSHWFIVQTECCNYTVRNYRSFSGFEIGGWLDVAISNDHAYLKIGKKVGKESVIKAERRPGFDPLLYIVRDPQGKEYRSRDIASMPEDWVAVALDIDDRVKLLARGEPLPKGCHFPHGIAGSPLPLVLNGWR